MPPRTSTTSHTTTRKQQKAEHLSHCRNRKKLHQWKERLHPTSTPLLTLNTQKRFGNTQTNSCLRQSQLLSQHNIRRPRRSFSTRAMRRLLSTAIHLSARKPISNELKHRNVSKSVWSPRTAILADSSPKLSQRKKQDWQRSTTLLLLKTAHMRKWSPARHGALRRSWLLRQAGTTITTTVARWITLSSTLYLLSLCTTQTVSRRLLLLWRKCHFFFLAS